MTILMLLTWREVWQVLNSFPPSQQHATPDDQLDKLDDDKDDELDDGELDVDYDSDVEGDDEDVGMNGVG